jgi:hypothetical protein
LRYIDKQYGLESALNRKGRCGAMEAR